MPGLFFSWNDRGCVRAHRAPHRGTRIAYRDAVGGGAYLASDPTDARRSLPASNDDLAHGRVLKRDLLSPAVRSREMRMALRVDSVEKLE